MLSSWDTNLAAVMVVGLERSPLTAPGAQTFKLRRVATSQLGAGLPKPQPPSRVWAMPGPAHVPVLKAQQPSWQSESWVQGSKTVACALPAGAAGVDEGDESVDEESSVAGAEAAGAAAPLPDPCLPFLCRGVKGILSSCATKAAAVWTPGSDRSPLTAPGAQSGSLSAAATLQLGAGLPKPQPPSRV